MSEISFIEVIHPDRFGLAVLTGDTAVSFAASFPDSEEVTTRWVSHIVDLANWALDHGCSIDEYGRVRFPDDGRTLWFGPLVADGDQ